ncbi:MAG: hypothetical protein GXO90_07085 [FCB group bacterium]|nr:hypothetical protein [FCB group bacterium]
MIYEPMTVFTDLLIAGFAVYFSVELNRKFGVSLMNTTWHWVWVFRFLAVGSLLGAISHGVGPYFPQGVRDWIWKGTTLSIGLVSFFFILAGFYRAFPYAMVQWLRWLPLLALLAYSVVILRDPRFINVVKFYAPSLILVLLIMIYSAWGQSAPGAGKIAIGIVISFMAAGVQVSGWDLHRNFNHNDLYHIVQIVGMTYIYRGALFLTDYGT